MKATPSGCRKCPPIKNIRGLLTDTHQFGQAESVKFRHCIALTDFASVNDKLWRIQLGQTDEECPSKVKKLTDFTIFGEK